MIFDIKNTKIYNAKFLPLKISRFTVHVQMYMYAHEYVHVYTGINGQVEVDGAVHKNWKIYSFEFPPSFIERYG